MIHSLSFFKAVEQGAHHEVFKLLDMDPELVLIENPDGLTALGLASHYGHIEVVRVLLEYGADVHQVSHSRIPVIPSNTALHAALAGNADTALLYLLLEEGAFPNALDSNGLSCLHIAAFDGDLDTLQLLLDFGADPMLKAPDGRIAMDIAKERKHLPAYQLLSKYQYSL